MLCRISLFSLAMLVSLLENTSAAEVLSTSSILKMSLSPQNKLPISIEHMFSPQSNITVVLTSCNRLKQLQVALNSFFHYNTYPIREFIILEDCEAKNQNKIWNLLPFNAKLYPQYFTVLVNHERQGQIGAIDTLYSRVKTQYVYHLEDDWVQLGTYGLIQRMYDALRHAEELGLKISQAVSTFPRWGWTHMPGQLQKSPHGTIFYKLKSYGKDWLYSFSFNPHLINYEKIYKQQLKGSLINSIARRYHCINDQESVFLDDGGCVQQYLGRYLTEQGYNQIYVQSSQKLVYNHTGTPDFKANPVQIDQLFMEDIENQQTINYEQVQEPKFSSQNDIDHGRYEKVKEKIRKLEDQVQALIMMAILLLILIVIIGIKCHRLGRKRKDPKAGRLQIKRDESTEEISRRIE